MTIEELELLIKQPESANFERKSAKNRFNEDRELVDYCAAIANEKGGKLILGVDKNGNIVGSNVYKSTLNTIPNEIYSKLKIRVDIDEIYHPKGRVLVFNIPPRPAGRLIKSTGDYKYPMRVGESLVEMDQQTIKKILNETEEFTSNTIEDLQISDLDKRALEKLKSLWSKKARRKDYFRKSDASLLRDLSLITNGHLTYAALIILGKKQFIGKHLPGAEIIFEWRTNKSKISHDFRKNWKDNFLNTFDDVWNTVNARNVRIPFQEGFIQREVWAFDEKTVREALLNAVAHRDYTDLRRSIFIKASPESFLIESPGGLISPVTIENILSTCAWRNRLLAETFEKAGLVERSGQGVDDIFEKTLRDGKGLPDFSGTDDSSVKLLIPAKIEDRKFILYLEKISNEKKVEFTSEEIVELEYIRKVQKIRNVFHKDKFLKLGIIEQVGKGRGTAYILSHKYYQHEGKTGIHTRLVGISREEKKLLILKHLKKNPKARLEDFQDIFTDLSKKEIQNLIQELRTKKQIRFSGKRRSGFWSLTN